MPLNNPLNSRQLQVLQWVADGCPAGRWDGSTYKTTAQALQSRRLITVSKRGGTWSAAIEPAGTYYLERGGYPDDHFPTRQRPALPTRKRQRGTGGTAPAEPLPMTGHELIEHLRSVGTLTVCAPSDGVRAAWRRTIHAAHLCDELAADEHITFTGRDSGDLTIALKPRTPDRPKPPPVPDIAATAEWPREAARFAKTTELIDASPGSADRARHLLHRLAVEAARRECRLTPRTDDLPGFQLSRGHFARDYQLTEEHDHAEVIPDEAVAAKKYAWQRVSPETRSVPSGRLVISHGGPYTRRSWADRKRWTLDDKLPEILADFETAATDHEKRRIRYESEKVRLKVEWEAALIAAKQAFIDDFNLNRLTDQVTRFDQSQRLRRYASAVRDTADENSAVALAWAAFAEARADALDPLQHPEQLRAEDPPSMHPWDYRSFMPRGMNVNQPPEPQF